MHVGGVVVGVEGWEMAVWGSEGGGLSTCSHNAPRDRSDAGTRETRRESRVSSPTAERRKERAAGNVCIFSLLLILAPFGENVAAFACLSIWKCAGEKGQRSQNIWGKMPISLKRQRAEDTLAVWAGGSAIVEQTPHACMSCTSNASHDHTL